MASLALVDSGSFTSNGSATPSLAWSSDRAALVAVASANSSTEPTSHTITGGGVTWVSLGGTTYRIRRRLDFFLATDGSGNPATPSDGALTITAVGGSTYAETMWIAAEVSDYDAASFNDSVNVKNVQGTSLTCDDLGTLDADDIAVIASGFEGATDSFAAQTGSTELEKLQNGGDVRSLLIAYSDSDETPGVQWSTSSNGAGLVGFIINNGLDGGGTADPTVTDVDTDETVTSDQTGVAVTGTDMGADETARDFHLVQGAVAVQQTETGTGTATAATLSIVTETVGADIKFGSATLRVTRDSDSATGSLAVTVNPPSGQLYVDVGTPNTTAANRITAVPDIETGDQIQARGEGGGAAPSGLTINADATFEFSSGNDPTDFDVRIWDVNDATWGAWATQTVEGLGIQPSDLTQDQVLDAPSLTQTHVLAPGDVAQVQALEAPSLTQDHQVVPPDVAQVQSLEAPTFEQVHVLAVADMAQLQSLDAVSLIVEGTVSPQSIAQLQELGAVVLTQDHQLVVADLAQLQALDAPTATQDVLVAPGGLAQAQSLDPVTLVVTGTLQPLSIAQLQALDTGQITQTHLLTPEDIAQVQVLGAPSTGAAGYLVVSRIRILPALDADVTVLPALTAAVSVKPH